MIMTKIIVRATTKPAKINQPRTGKVKTSMARMRYHISTSYQGGTITREIGGQLWRATI